jgi:hypothetical protein
MEAPTTPNWSLFRKVLFRFFFIYLLLQAAPWSWLDHIPGVDFLLNYFNEFIDWMVQTANTKLFHIRKVLVSPAGSGDTSWAWAQQWLYICIAFAGCLAWSFFDRKRKNYIELNYWLCLIVRYYVITIAFGYGLSKVFPLQMPFPNQPVSHSARRFFTYAPIMDVYGLFCYLSIFWRIYGSACRKFIALP